MRIVGIPTRSDNYTWLIQADEPKNPHTWVVDPGESAKAIAYFQQHQLNLAGILLTHHHYDHTDGVLELLSTLGNENTPVIGNQRGPFKHITHPVNEGDNVNLFGETFKVIATPGHVHEHIVFYHPKALFCGDAIFTGGCGKTWTQGPEWMASSLLKLRDLNDDCLVYCAHEYTYANMNFACLTEPENIAMQQRLLETKQKTQQNMPCVPSLLGLEKQTNPFLRFDLAPLKQVLLAQEDCQADTDAERYASLRAWKDRLDKTGELEAGLHD